MRATPECPLRTGRPSGRRTRSSRSAAAAAAVGLLVPAGAALAQPTVRLPDSAAERRISREQITLETLRVDGPLQSWVLRKICLDGQVYWIGFGETTPTAMAPSYRDGKPEQCGGGAARAPGAKP